MDIHYAGKITSNEHLKCYSLHYAQSFRLLKRVFGGIMLALIFSNVFLILQGSSEDKSVLRDTYLYSVILVGFLTFPWWFPYTQVRAARRRGGIYQGQVSGAIDDSQVTVNGPAIRSAFQWGDFHSFKMGDGVILLYTAKNTFAIFTKRLFASQTEWDAFASLVRQKLLG